MLVDSSGITALSTILIAWYLDNPWVFVVGWFYIMFASDCADCPL